MNQQKSKPIPVAVPTIKSDRLADLYSIFPEAFSEGKVDFEKLRATLGDMVDDRPERYSFSWAGKRDAIRLLQTPTRATLVPAEEESVDFDTTQNLFIEGENLEVLKLLYKPYFGRIKLIYIDPPYNTGNDFIYTDDYSDPLGKYLELTGQLDKEGNLLTSNPETSGRYHSAWLSMMYPRLFLARQLLREDGVIFVSIDDHELHNLRLLMNEIFGEENFINTIIWQKVFAPKNTARHFSEDHDYIVVYARNSEIWLPNLLPRREETVARYQNPDNDPRGPWSSSDLTARNFYSLGQYEVTSPSGKKFKPTIGTYWRMTHEKFLELEREGRIWWGRGGDNMPRLKRFLSDVKEGIVPQTLWFYSDVGHTQDAKKVLLDHVPFEYTENVLNTVKPPDLIKRILQISTNPESQDIVLDFFAGSSSTAHAIMEQNKEDNGNRRYIMVQFPEKLPKPEQYLKTINDIGLERIRNLGARLMEDQNSAQLKFSLETPKSFLDMGFRLYKLTLSHFKPWFGVNEKDSQAYAQQMELYRDPLLEGWTDEGVLTELAIKHGFSLSAQIEALEGVEKLYLVSDFEKEQSFLVCLASRIALENVAALNLQKEDLFVCRDVALDDETAANLALQCRLETI
jgi:adenine-specific DNA-methyltransferase